MRELIALVSETYHATMLSMSLGALAQLRCNTYIGTDVSTGGAGTESCVAPIARCVQREFYVLGVRTYSMSCDDLLQCTLPHPVPSGTCCTKPDSSMRYPTVVRCSDHNFNESKLNASNFDSPDCRQNCSALQR